VRGRVRNVSIDDSLAAGWEWRQGQLGKGGSGGVEGSPDGRWEWRWGEPPDFGARAFFRAAHGASLRAQEAAAARGDVTRVAKQVVDDDSQRAAVPFPRQPADEVVEQRREPFKHVRPLGVEHHSSAAAHGRYSREGTCGATVGCNAGFDGLSARPVELPDAGLAVTTHHLVRPAFGRKRGLSLFRLDI
jgi:hypothetical protein